MKVAVPGTGTRLLLQQLAEPVLADGHQVEVCGRAARAALPLYTPRRPAEPVVDLRARPGRGLVA